MISDHGMGLEGGEPLLKFERAPAVLEELNGLEVWVKLDR